MATMTNAPSPRTDWRDTDVLWQHRALCGLALPLRAPRAGFWSREVDGSGAAMGSQDAPASERALPLPAGCGVRLLLLHAFTAALREGSAAVPIGPDAASVAASLGLDTKLSRITELEQQAGRLLASRLRITDPAGGALLPVLDARGRPAARPGWRTVLRLNARFFENLGRNAVALDRAVVASLSGSAAALDAYAWLMASRPDAEAAQPIHVPWGSLQDRFGQAASPPPRFVAAFTESLAAIRELCPAARFTVGESGVELHGMPEPGGAAAAERVVPAQARLPDGLPAPAAGGEGDVLPTDDGPVQGGLSTPAPSLPAAVPERTCDAGRPSATVPSAPVPRLVQPLADTASPVGPGQPASERGMPRLREADGGRICLPPRYTGLPQTVWLRRGGGQFGVTIEVTPGAEYQPARRSLLVVEPMVMQVVGQLQQRELDQVAAWVMANSDLIQDYWDGLVPSGIEVPGRIRRVPSLPRW